MVYIPGRKHYTPDALSRYPTVSGIFNSSRKEPSLSISHLLAGIRSSEPDQEHTVDTELTVAAMNAFSTANIKCVTWNDVRTATVSDDNMQQLLELIENGTPDQRDKWPIQLRVYYQFRKELYHLDGIILFGTQVVIPPSLRSTILSSLHSVHQGVTQMMAPT